MAANGIINVLLGLIGKTGTTKVLELKAGQEVNIPAPENLASEH